VVLRLSLSKVETGMVLGRRSSRLALSKMRIVLEPRMMSSIPTVRWAPVPSLELMK
jgi:hypothetical protein